MDQTIQIKCRGADVASIDDLVEMQGNLKELSDKNYAKLHDLLITKGFRAPIFIWVNSEGQKQILDGHQRIRTLRRMRDSEGYTIPPLPIDYIEAENKKDAKETLLTFVSQYGKVMEEGFYEFTNEPNFVIEPNFSELLDIPNLDFEYGNKPPVIEDEAPAVNDKEPAISQLGEVYQLGRHRLMCGDATKIEDVEKLMGGQKADMIFTDPPYGMFLDADFSDMKNSLDFAKDKGFVGGRKYENVKGDHKDFNPDFINTIFSAFGYCKEVFLWGANYYSELLLDRNSGSWFVWDKRLDESADKMYGSGFELCWSKSKHKQDVVRVKWAGVFGTEKEPDKERFHPTQKPVVLSAWFINRFSDKDNVVLDLFGGSGSTLIACEHLFRRCYMIELDCKYADVIRKRYAQFIGQADNWEEVTSPI